MIVRSIRSTVLPFAVVLVFVACAGPATAWEVGGKYALLVGVETYNPQFFNRLQFAEDDALEMGRVLKSLDFETTAMVHSAEIPALRPSTAEKILRQLNLRLADLTPADTLIVSFSGHGVQFKNDPPLPDGSLETYFCPEEADPRDRSTLVPLNEVYRRLAGCPAGRKLLIVDACRNAPFSGLDRSAREIELEPAGRKPIRTPQGILALFSCASGEQSWEHPELKHGVFCYHVLEYLMGKAGPQFYRNDELRIDDLLYYVRRSTSDFAKRQLSVSQSPEFVGRTGDWDLGRLRPPQLVDSVGIALTLIQPGSFFMGSRETPAEIAATFQGEKEEDFEHEHPRHRVTLTRPFYLGKHEVTIGQFRRFVEATGYRTDAESGLDKNNPTGADELAVAVNWRNSGHAGLTDNHPVTLVTWNDATRFCRWLSAKEKVTYRMPTQAEWEYACRAGTDTRYWTGDDPESLAAFANVPDAASLEGKPPKDYSFAVYSGDTTMGKNGWVTDDVALGERFVFEAKNRVWLVASREMNAANRSRVEVVNRSTNSTLYVRTGEQFTIGPGQTESFIPMYNNGGRALRIHGNDGFPGLAPVGQFPANAFGLHDMHGNVWEWCGDGFLDYNAGIAVDPVGPALSNRYVIRGGCFL